MTATPQPAWTPPRNDGHLGAGRIAALVLGILLLIPGIALVSGGGVLLWADLTQRSDDGYLITTTETFRSDGSALVSERIEVAGVDWLPFSAAVGTARLGVTPTDRDTEVFVGLAPVDAASAYLEGVGRTVVNDLGADSSDQDLIPGGPPPGPPGAESFWVEQASGPGTQEITWAPAEGDWMLVVMNADGASGLAVDARAGATVPALTGVAWALLVPGLLFLAVGVLVIVLAVRRRGTTGPPPGGAAAVWGPAPAWQPPAPRDGTSAPDGSAGYPTPSRGPTAPPG